MKKEKYFEPKIDITKFATDDIMLDSNELPFVPFGDENGDSDDTYIWHE